MAKQMTADEESILKRQARRRLIGAVALATAVVVILPIVFDSEPPPSAVSDIELRIPDKDKTVDFQSSAALSGVSEASAVAPVSAVASVALPVAAAAIVVAPVVATVSPHSPEGGGEETKADVVKSAPQEQKTESKPKVESEAKAATSHPAPHSGYVVQVGAFTNADAAKKLQDKLLAQGLHAYTEKVGANIRVRVGSYPTHDAAEKIRHKLEAQGLHPNVVSLGG
jgi:DedD protein